MVQGRSEAYIVPFFFFNLRNQDELHEDETGMDLPDIYAALQEALRVDRELTTEPAGLYGLEYEITDESGRTLLKVPIQERRRNSSLLKVTDARGEHRRLSDRKKPLH